MDVDVFFLERVESVEKRYTVAFVESW